MLLDPTSRWYVEVEEAGAVVGFDTPKCALTHTLDGHRGATVRLRSYYGQKQVTADEVRFAVGSDVLGPMGNDLIPIEPEHVEKFKRDHHPTAVLSLAELTAEIVKDL